VLARAVLDRCLAARAAVKPAGGGRIPAVALGGYGVDASVMSFWLHDGGIQIVWDPLGAVLVVPV
jgi:hypothetical protein